MIKKRQKKGKKESRSQSGRQKVGNAEDSRFDSIAIRKKNRMRRRRNFFSVLFFIILICAIYFGTGLDYFIIREIRVKNNIHFTSEEVIQIADAETGKNMFRILLTPWKKNLLNEPYISDAHVRRRLPDLIEITVYEREEKYAVAQNGGYVIIDEQGVALKHVTNPGVYTVIDGIKLEKITLGQKIKDEGPLQNEDKSLTLLNEFENSTIDVQKILFADNLVTVQIFSNLVCKAEYNSVGGNLQNLEAVLSDLSARNIKRGTIRIANDGSISFSPQI